MMLMKTVKSHDIVIRKRVNLAISEGARRNDIMFYVSPLIEGKEITLITSKCKRDYMPVVHDLGLTASQIKNMYRTGQLETLTPVSASNVTRAGYYIQASNSRVTLIRAHMDNDATPEATPLAKRLRLGQEDVRYIPDSIARTVLVQHNASAIWVLCSSETYVSTAAAIAAAKRVTSRWTAYMVSGDVSALPTHYKRGGPLPEVGSGAYAVDLITGGLLWTPQCGEWNVGINCHQSNYIKLDVGGRERKLNGCFTVNYDLLHGTMIKGDRSANGNHFVIAKLKEQLLATGALTIAMNNTVNKMTSRGYYA